MLYESTARSRLEAAGEHRPDPARGPGAGGGAAAGALGAGQGRPRAGGAAQRRSGHRQIAPGAGADGTRGHRAPGVADAVPVFALLPEHRLVSHDRAAGAGGAALRAGGVPDAEAPQTGGVLGAVWPAAGGGRAPLCRPPLPAAGRRLCPPDLVARAAEAEDPARPPDDPAAHRRPAAGALRHGRPALGRSRPRWSCSASWSIKAPPPASWRCSPVGPTSARPGRGARTSPR